MTTTVTTGRKKTLQMLITITKYNKQSAVTLMKMLPDLLRKKLSNTTKLFTCMGKKETKKSFYLHCVHSQITTAFIL